MAVTVKFVGGFKDGRELRSNSNDPNEAQEAVAFYAMTDDGKVGKRCKAISDAGLAELKDLLVVDGDEVRLKKAPSTSMSHVYEIVSREEIDDDIVVRFEYQGQIKG